MSVGAVVACCALAAACTQEPAQTSSPSPTPAAATPTESQIERQMRLDYEAAEKAYRANRAEQARLYQAGGTTEATSAMRATATASYLRITLRPCDVLTRRTGMRLEPLKSWAWSGMAVEGERGRADQLRRQHRRAVVRPLGQGGDSFHQSALCAGTQSGKTGWSLEGVKGGHHQGERLQRTAVQSVGRYLLAIGAVAVLVSTVWVPVAWSEVDVTCTDAGVCLNVAKRPERSTLGNSSEGTSPRHKADGQDDNAPRVLDAGNFSADLADYDRQLASYNRCVLIFDPSLNNAGCGSAPTPPNAPQFSNTNFSGPGNQPTAGQAAAIAVARLQLPKIPPGIGPSPDINPWKMAAVGYPLWLWADGPTHVGPISDSVAGLFVSLDAEVSSLTFRMGDGHTSHAPDRATLGQPPCSPASSLRVAATPTPSPHCRITPTRWPPSPTGLSPGPATASRA